MSEQLTSILTISLGAILINNFIRSEEHTLNSSHAT